MKAEGDGEWLARKHGPSKPRDWRKVHLGIDAETLEIRAIEVTGSRVGDAPMLPDLLDQIPGGQPLGMVTADGAYDSRPFEIADHLADVSGHYRASSMMISPAFQPTMIEGALVLPAIRFGKAAASATRSPCTPCTRSRASITEVAASRPIRAVQDG